MFFDLVVQTNLGLLQERLRELSPSDEITVQPLQDAIVLTGAVSSQRLLNAAQEVTTAFAPRGRVVNLLTVTPVKVPQVMLQVHVAEVSRNILRELGFSFLALGTGVVAAYFSPFLPVLQAFPTLDITNASFLLQSGNGDYTAVVRALAQRGLIRTLANPNLVTESGREARFLSGGEVPYPVAQGNGAIAVEFKPFGVGLVFTPVILDGETISLEVRPEVSNLDFARGVPLAPGGAPVPALVKNEAFTHINLKDGESFAIAGLINNDVRQSVSKTPVLGDIPIIGALFRSTTFETRESELLFVVTVKQVRPGPMGSTAVPDPLKLFQMRPEEKKEFTLVPGVPGVGEIIQKPLGESNLVPSGVPSGGAPAK
jgi:pilus assembly protein CpaC